MRTRSTGRRQGGGSRQHAHLSSTGITWVDVVSIAALVVFVGLLLPIWTQPRGCRAARVNCVSNLKQVGLSFRMWANDYQERFPWQVPSSEGGTMDLAESGPVYIHFQAISNELSSPKVLACSHDKKVVRATSWTNLHDGNLSYFIGLDADEVRPQSILSGDRNIVGGEVVTNGVRRFSRASRPAYTTGIHNRQGNLGLGDGSAQQVTDGSLRKQIESALIQAETETLRLSFPSAK